jgi:hypothetical protein
MEPSTTNEIRPLNDDEIARLENALGQPIERPYLVKWVSRAIQAFVVIVTLPPPGERRDDLREIAEQGRKWIETVEQSRSARLLPGPVDVQHLIGSARTFCQVAESLARQLDQAVGPGHPRTTAALEAFLDRLIGIAKRAKILPSTPSRDLLDLVDAPPGPPFFRFVTAALDIAMAVIRSSPLPCDQMDAALAGLSKVTDQALAKTLERLRGRVGQYRESAAGLVEWDAAEAVEPAPPQARQSNSE